jgi:ubiquinol-cytochrome c reductase cytochrome c subunit
MKQLSCRALAGVVTLGVALVATAGAQPSWLAPESEKNRKSPGAAGPKVLEQGKKVAQVSCASCHGNTGRGNGPAAMALSLKPADWTSK